MRPTAFGGCFGWLHTSEASGEIGVVLCTGLGRDASNAHHSWRSLADALAASGYPTLRFDYPGAGDSLDVDAGAVFSVWQQSVRDAADWLRETTRVRHLILIGLRLGASLAAMEASSRADVAGLILIEPILRGRSFATQLTVEARLRRVTSTQADGIEANELRLDSATLGLIAQIDLRRVVLGPVQLAVFCQERTALLSECAQAWRAGALSVDCLDFAGLEPLLRPSHLASAPLNPTGILSWLQATLPIRLGRPACDVSEPTDIVLRPGGCIENPIRFGLDQALFGMLCRPTGSDPDLVVVIGNTGGDPHHGFARFSVELARRLACVGIASFRIDFAGLGDSAGPSIDDEAMDNLFTVDRSAEIEAALDEMQALGFRRFALNGLCSGAYHAFHGALADRRVTEVLLVNLPFFTVRLDRPGPDSFARRGIADLSTRQVRTLLLFAEEDAGIRVLDQHFGPGASGLQGSAAVVAIIPDLDHDLTGSAMRRTVADRMIDFLLSPASARRRVAAE